MIVTLTPDDLIKFEETCCDYFKEKKVHGPIHLYDNCEKEMIEVYEKYVNDEDYVCCSWRSHYQCLLKGVPQEEMLKSICEGKSISLCFPNQKVISSGIVGGILPIAVGIAMGIKRQNKTNKVVCHVGDMTSESGIFHECLKYSTNHELPILWVVENNKKSVCTPTRDVWNLKKFTFEPENYQGGLVQVLPNVLYFEYTSKYPHAGGNFGRIQF